MAELSYLEYKFKKDYHTAFEDMSTLIFCTELGLSRGVNRRTNQKSIEADPIKIGERYYAYQAKYYEASTTLITRKQDFLDCIIGASSEKVTDLYFFINKNMPNKSPITGKEVKYISDIEETARKYKIKLYWRTLSQIETTLDLPKYKFIRELYYGNPNSETTDFSAFYEYTYNAFYDDTTKDLYGDAPFHNCYIEPYIETGASKQSVRSYLESFVNSKDNISVICGEPGQGKTSFCRKAMIDFYKNGWLCGVVSNVFCFSLNPASTDALDHGSFSLDKLLSWGRNRQDSSHIIHSNLCKNALILFDGFDELLEWYPKFNIMQFIETEIAPFQRETGSHIIITCRSMALKLQSISSLNYKSKVQYKHLALMSRIQQLDWISLYIEHCKKNAPEKVNDLENYLESYSKINYNHDLSIVLGIPIIFRMLVNAQYPPACNQSITLIYNDLFHITWRRHRRETFTDEAELSTKRILANLALSIFLDDNDTAEATLSIDSSWVFSFYTSHDGNKRRVGFSHRSFYQYFLAYKILSWYEDFYKEKNTERFVHNLSCLAKRRIDKTTITNIKVLFDQLPYKDDLQNAFSEAYRVLKRTDGFLELPLSESQQIKLEDVSPLKRANNVFWNIVSIGSACKYSISKDIINIDGLRRYDLTDSILIGANFEITALDDTNDIDRIELEGAQFRGADLSHAKLSRIYFRCANLNHANLSHANLRGADLRDSNFSYAVCDKIDLNGANLAYSNLSCANFSYATLSNTSLKGSNLYNADLRKADFTGSKLSEANLHYADLRDAVLCDANLCNANLRNALLSFADLCKANLKEPDFRNSYLCGALFCEANLTNANFTNADLSKANFYKTDLRWAVFERTIFNETFFYAADLRWTKLSDSFLIGVDLSEADISIADLSYANLSRSILHKTNFKWANLQGADFSKADLSNSYLMHANLSGVDFRDADLKEANLSNTILERADFRNAKLSNAILEGANLHDIMIDKPNAEYLSHLGYDISDMIIRDI